MADRYRQIFENANDVIYTTDLEHRITALNKAGIDLTGYSCDEVIGKKMDLIVPAQYILLFEEMKNRMIAGQVSAIYEIEVLTRHGRGFPAEVSARLIYDLDEPVGIQGILRDVSDRKRLQEQFLRSQRLEAVGQLTGGIAHDFNNMLTIILGYADATMESLGSNHPAYGQVDGIRKSADRASALARQLLAFSRRQVLQPRVLQINSVISDVEKLLMKLIGDEVELATDLDPEVGLVKADPGQIEQILMNLVINARDAMPRGGKITVTTSNSQAMDTGARESHFPYVLLEVADTGHGMNEETLSHIFEPFFTTKEVGKGTGLGLATVYGIVKHSGGFIWAESRPGHGATFRILLPETSEALTDTDEIPPILRAGGGAEVVLVVEDEAELRELIAQTLRYRGYTVLEATNGADALRVLQECEDPIDVAIIDIVMPKMGGVALAEHIAICRPGTSIMFMSGYADDAILLKTGLNSTVQILQKPFEPSRLAEKIREILDENKVKTKAAAR
jgi:two-component system, cell cycle sensor histidine kinase and response regulator CckA